MTAIRGYILGFWPTVVWIILYTGFFISYGLHEKYGLIDSSFVKFLALLCSLGMGITVGPKLAIWTHSKSANE